MLSKKTAQARKKEVCRWLRENGIRMALLEDREGRRDSSIRYLTGMPGDSLLFIFPQKEGKTILLPWDAILAEKTARADEIIPYEEFGRSTPAALTEMIRREGLKSGSAVELSSQLPAWELENYRLSHQEMEFICRPGGLAKKLADMRAVKDESELELIQQAAVYTNRLVSELEMEIRKGGLRTEMDAALFLERRSRTLGCDGMGFETLAAGPDRSWGIHAFPAYTAGPFCTPGFSLIDFGVKYQGYVSDVTASFVRGTPDPVQKEMLQLVEKAYNKTAGMLKPGASTLKIAQAAAEVFKSKDRVMPHLLGHGIGLDAHEGPYFRLTKEAEEFLAPGMVVTLEPGLYDKRHGGIRWENDFLITPDGARALTESRIFTLP